MTLGAEPPYLPDWPLLALSVFVVGAVIGAWAGVVRIWPVRYSLQLLEGPPKPFVNEPESPPLALDSAGRLLRYAGKIEVPCPKQTQRTAVLLIAGQSNAANNAAQRHGTRYPDRVLNFMGGRCYVAGSPLLGSTGFAGEYWTLMADQLIDAGAFDRVILAPVAVGGSNIAQWAKGGALNTSMIPLVQDLVTHYRVTARSLAPGRIRLRPQDRSGRATRNSSCRSPTACAPTLSMRRFSFRRRPAA